MTNARAAAVVAVVWMAVLAPVRCLADPEPQGLQAKPRPLTTWSITPQSWLIGTATSRVPGQGETFLEIGEEYDLGYNEVIAANRNSDPWIPKHDEPLVVASRWLLPDAPRDGLVLNIPEMRLYYFRDHGTLVITVPVGLGREYWKTRQGSVRFQ